VPAVLDVGASGFGSRSLAVSGLSRTEWTHGSGRPL